jgi:putative ABC transport system permease protein
MLKKQLRFSLRRLSRHKLTTVINTLGLSFGILSCLVIYLYVAYEFSYDKFHAEGDRIYRVIVWTDEPTRGHNEGPNMPPPLASDLRREVTGFSAVTGFFTDDTRVLVPVAGKPPRVIPTASEGEQLHINLADSQYLTIFHYQWLAGNAATALQNPYSVVLTESEGRRYFGTGQPADWIGHSLVYFDTLTVSVTGIVKDWQQNSDFGFKDLISYNTLAHSFAARELDSYRNFPRGANAYVKLSPGTTVAQVEKQFPDFFRRHGQFPDEVKAGLKLQPLADIHFNGAYLDLYGRRAHKPTLIALAGIALFILVIAAINFINLSTAQSILRAREVGVRKVLGSSRSGLVLQFLSETGIIVLAAMVLALLLANPVIYALHGALRAGPTGLPEGVKLHIGDPMTWLFLALTVLVTCLLAGWYPARVLSSFLPVVSLRGQGAPHLNSKSYLRKGLIVFQFTVSLVFIIGTIMVGRQIHFMLNTDLGFKKDAIYTIDIPWREYSNSKSVLSNELRRLPGIQQVSLSDGSPQGPGHGGTFVEYRGRNTTRIDADVQFIDTNYMSVYGLNLVAGRNFYTADTLRRGSDPGQPGSGPAQPAYMAYILNETAARSLGFNKPADAVGQQISTGFFGIPGPVVGVVRDFHGESLLNKIKPYFFTTQKDAGAMLSLKLSSAALSPGQIKTLLTQLEAVFKKVYPATSFQARFFDEALQRLYEREQQTAQIMNLAMGIAIFISCMGLFGLAAFTANQRTKEIGIRKVLGADVPHLVSLLSRDFILLVVLSTLIAAPIAGWAMHRWLQDYAYRTSMPWWIYALAGVAAITIALLTVSFQAIRAATANPVKSLRVE